MPEIYYLGGSPCSGKSTIAEMLVEKYGFQYYKQDDHLEEYIKKGASEGYDLFKKVSLMTAEEMWMRDPVEQCNEEISLYEIMLLYAINDMSDLTKESPIIAEGAGFLPHLIKKMSVEKSHYICIVPTKEFQVMKYSQRPWISHYLSGCLDKDKAFQNWMERDALLAKIVLQEAENLGYEYLIVDGSQGIDDNFAIIEKTFCLRVV